MGIDLEGIERRIEEAGGGIKAHVPFPGGRRFRFEDRDGQELAVWSDRELSAVGKRRGRLT